MAIFKMSVSVDGAQERCNTPCRKFSHTIGGEKFWFALHQVDGEAVKTVSHFESGKRVCASKYGYIAGQGAYDEVSGARKALDELVGRVGEARVRSVLAGA